MRIKNALKHILFFVLSILVHVIAETALINSGLPVWAAVCIVCGAHTALTFTFEHLWCHITCACKHHKEKRENKQV